MARRFKVETIFSGVDRITAPLNRIQARVSRFSRSVRRRLDAMSATAARWQSAMFTGAKVGSLAIAGLAASVGVAVNKFAGYADELAKRSRRLEFPVEDLQAWGFVAEQAGFASAEFDKGLEGLARRMGEMRAGTGSLYSYLLRTDRQLLRQLQTTDSMSDALVHIIDALRGQPDAFRRAALANAAFGRQGLKMANLSEMGAESIEKLMREMRENGLITQAAANDAETFNDAVNSTSKAVAGLTYEALTPLLPLLTVAATRTRSWLIENRGLMASKFNDWVLTILDNFDQIVASAARIGKALAVFVVGTTIIRTVSAAMVGVAAAIRTVILMWGLLNAAFMASPLGRMLMAGGALATAASYVVGSIDDQIKQQGVGRAVLSQIPGMGGFDVVDRLKADAAAREQGDTLPVGWRPWKPEGLIGGLFDGVSSASLDDIMGRAKAFAIGPQPEDRDDQDVTALGRTLREISDGVRQSIEQQQQARQQSVEVTIKDESGRAEVTRNDMQGHTLIMENMGGVM